MLDRAHDRARLEAPGPSGSPAPGAIPLTFRDGLPRLTAVLDGVAAEALFDSGDNALFSLGYGAYRVGPAWPVVGRGRASGIGGSDDVLEVTVPSASVGPLALGPARAVVRRTQSEPARRHRPVGSLRLAAGRGRRDLNSVSPITSGYLGPN